MPSGLATLALVFALAAAAPAAARPPTVADLARDPKPWADRTVRLEGLVVYEFEHLAIYPSHADFCAGRNGFGVNWGKDILPIRDSRRLAVVRGRVHVPEDSNVREISNAFPEEHLEDVRVMGWLSDPLPKCRSRGSEP